MWVVKLVEMVIDKSVALVGMLIDKLRVNVIILALLITWLILDFGNKLIDKLPEEIGSDVLTMLIGVGIGGLLTAMVRMFESPSVPADFAERAIKNAGKRDD